MAVLSKHGDELYRYVGLTFTLSFRADGQIMRNYGQGWKLYKKTKPGVNPAEYAERQKQRHLEMDRKQPAFCELRDAMIDLVSMKNRPLVYEALKLLADDPDGMYSDLSDHFGYSSDGPDLSLEDCLLLCRLYKAAARECAEQKTQAGTPAEVNE